MFRKIAQPNWWSFLKPMLLSNPGLSSEEKGLISGDKIIFDTPPSSNIVGQVSSDDADGDGIVDSIHFFFQNFERQFESDPVLKEQVQMLKSNPMSLDDDAAAYFADKASEVIKHEFAHLTGKPLTEEEGFRPESDAEAEVSRYIPMSRFSSKGTTNIDDSDDKTFFRKPTGEYQMGKELILLANHLDSIGHNDLADRLDRITKSASPYNPTELEVEMLARWRDRLSTLEAKRRPSRRDREQIEKLKSAIEPYDLAAQDRERRRDEIEVSHSGLLDEYDDELASTWRQLDEATRAPIPDVELTAPPPEPSPYEDVFRDRPEQTGGEAVTLDDTAYNREFLDPLVWKESPALISHGEWQYQVIWPSDDVIEDTEPSEREGLISFRVVTVPPGYRKSRYFVLTSEPKYRESWDTLKALLDESDYHEDQLGELSGPWQSPAEPPREPELPVAEAPAGQPEGQVAEGTAEATYYTSDKHQRVWKRFEDADGNVTGYEVPTEANENQGRLRISAEQGAFYQVEYSDHTLTLNSPKGNMSWVHRINRSDGTSIPPLDQASDAHLKDATLDDLASNFTFGMRHPAFRR